MCVIWVSGATLRRRDELWIQQPTLSRSCVCEAGDCMTIPTAESKQIQVCVLIIIIIVDIPNSRRDSRSVELWNSCFPKVIYLHTPQVGPEPSFLDGRVWFASALRPCFIQLLRDNSTLLRMPGVLSQAAENCGIMLVARVLCYTLLVSDQDWRTPVAPPRVFSLSF